MNSDSLKGKFNVDDLLAMVDPVGQESEKDLSASAAVQQKTVKSVRKKKDTASSVSGDSGSGRIDLNLPKELIYRMKVQAYQESISCSFLVSRILEKNIKSMEQIIADMKK